MTKKSLTAMTIIFILSCFIMIGCGDNNGCKDYKVPSGYDLVDKFAKGDYRSVTYNNGSHWITFQSSDDGCHWDKSQYWGTK